MGLYGGYKYSKRAIHAFYIWGLTRCFFAALDIYINFIYLVVLGLWIYWTVVIRRFYKMLTMQQLNANNSGYSRYNEQPFDANNPYAVTNEGAGYA